ncbi:hypothetical protein F5883DRAFT_654926 [Diaporthe sp. PMI_573]|nr:hypothetical protein F5883DRAFT_654926 [Diaporthaceae sp. PMI_573]
MLDDDREVKMKLRRKLDLGMDYFLGVKNALLLWLAMWDELLGQKRRYDLQGTLPTSREMLNASFLCIVTVARRLNIGPGYPFLARSELSPVASHTPGLPETGEYLGATVTGMDTEANDDPDLTDFDELDTLSALDPSYSDTLFDSGTEDACSQNDSGDKSDNARRNAEFTKFTDADAPKGSAFSCPEGKCSTNYTKKGAGHQCDDGADEGPLRKK